MVSPQASAPTPMPVTEFEPGISLIRGNNADHYATTDYAGNGMYQRIIKGCNFAML